MNGANLSQSADVCEDENTTTLPKKCARRSVDVVAGVRIVKCHASMDVECHASIHVIIGIRVVLCHPLVDFPLFWIFTSCPNSHLVVILQQFIITLTCNYFAHVLHRENTSFEVWYLHFHVGYSRPPSAVNDTSVTK